MSSTAAISALALFGVLGSLTAAAQQPEPRMSCDDEWRHWPNGSSNVCDIREVTIPATGSLSVDAGPNGGIEVIGADRNDVLVRSRVNAWAEEEDEARALAEEVVVQTDDVIRAAGPERRGRAGWSVSYEIFAPRATNLRLETHNGGIALTSLRGDLDFQTSNGGLSLDGLAGNVRGRTTNGGIDVTLRGDRWDGESLDVRTTNGGIRLRIPEDYSVRLETGTVNGRTRVDFPITVQGRIGRELSASLGGGGALVRAQTTNGAVRLSRY